MGAQAVRLSNVDIDNALRNRDFEVLFQPIFDLGNGALARMETFVRWRHASLGLLPPGAFISFFESQGRMSELTRYVFSEALKQYRGWRGSSAPGFSINLALSDLADEAFASHFDVLLRDSGFPAELITLECPMPPVTMPIAAASEQFARLAETGARLAIEVRGRANDFLKTVDPFPFDEIKTGGAAILRFARTVRGPGLSAISELLDIANKANAAITAVGVEDQASLAALRGLGFAAAQGNHLGKVGGLGAFTPGRVNEVRGLLGLEALSSIELHALFRTEAPAPKAGAAPVATATGEPDEVARPDALVERLAARIARQAEPASSPTAEPMTEPIAEAGAKAAKARATAKRASANAAVKAAAIARAKRKASASAFADLGDEYMSGHSGDGGEMVAARDLQKRLTREFPEATAPAVASFHDAADALSELADEFGFAGDRRGLDSSPDLAQETESAMATAVDQDAEEAAGENGSDVRKDAEAGAGAAEPAELVAGESDEEEFKSASLAVAGARAYFRPGNRVGILRPQPPSNDRPRFEPPPALREDASAAPVAEPEQPVIAAPIYSERVEDPAETASVGDALEPQPEAEVSAAPSIPPKSRPKNFLTRTVIPYPTHFWPRWMRKRRRRVAIDQA